MSDTARADGLIRLTQSVDWAWMYHGVAILTERPMSIRRDTQGRLHDASGPAITYRDGWAVHAWHGTRVPADLIEGRWDLATAMREPNTEIRRCAIEYLAGRDGWGGIAREAGWPLIGTAKDPGSPGQMLHLYRVPDETQGGLYDEPVALLHCINATREMDGARHEYGLTVPGHITDPIAAAAWGFDIPADDYRALARAC